MQGITFRGSKGGKIVQSSFTRQEKLGDDEVVVQVTHSGLCGTDLHYLEQDIVLGHEAIGTVQAVGPKVKSLKVGDRVGWGYQHGSCLEVNKAECDMCLTGNDQYCSNAKMYGSADFDQGSFSNIGIWNEKWLFPVPKNLKSEHAAPLMCGGATVFTPLVENVKPIHRVGIVGVGGLGHIAIQFAAKMGCEVIVFSGTDSKRDEAISLGAREFYATKGVDDLTKLGLPLPIDRLILTTSALEDVGKYYPILSQQAIIMPLTVSENDLPVPHQKTILKGVKIVGTILATRYMQIKMLQFADRNDIKPMVEMFPMTADGITEAVQKLKEGKMRYRGVLGWDLAK